MNCPHCGVAVPSGAGRCAVCNRALQSAGQVAAGVLTPLPTPAPVEGGTELPGLTGSLTHLGETPTGFMPPSIEPDAATGFVALTAHLHAETGGPGTPRSEETSGTGNKGPLAVGQSFGPRYHIIRELGVGGMGAVYQAWDSELGVSVAIKVIRPEIMADPGAGAEVERRFRRELLLARQVTHKNVVRIHDLGEIGGIKYITMSYVNGTDLATLLKREGRLPVERVLHIARPIVSGLIAAHAADVVHRDLKPANIMIVADDEALIMDFGIARSTSGGGAKPAPDFSALPAHVRRATARRSDATLLGAVVGTVEYMAPEQAKGQEVDQRADIYALGLMLYDMLVGRRRAEQAPTAINELQLRMQQAPPPVKSLVAEVPEALNIVISRCLDPDPAKRWQTTVELEAELNRLDEHGEFIPIPARFSKRMIAGAVTLVLALVTATWWFTWRPPPPKQHDPVSVIIADFQNGTGDPTFDGTLEQTLKRALEGAGFINAYDRTRIRGTFGVQPPEKLTEVAARELAVKQGLGVVVSGSIDKRGDGYEVSAKATQTITGNVIATANGRASSKDQVLGAITKLTTTVRKALGDKTSASDQMFAMTSLSATSLEVVHQYAAGIEASSNNKLELAREIFFKTVQLDPNFGLGYQGIAAVSGNLGNLQERDKYAQEALRHLDRMTDRERLATRGYYNRVRGDYQQCIKEYGELIAQYAADAVAHNQRALCLSKLRNLREAVDEMRKAVDVLPKQLVFRGNLALYADYAGDFDTAQQEVRAIEQPTDLTTLAMAFAQLGQGLIPETTETYRALGMVSTRGASWSASGLGDLAVYEGRFSDAVQILEKGAAADLAAKSPNPDRAARKLIAVAYTQLLRRRPALAIAAAERALMNSQVMAVRFLAGRIFLEAGAIDRARGLAADFAKQLSAEPHAYGKIIEGGIALKHGDVRQAVSALEEANGQLNTWLGHFDLGRAYLAANEFTKADSEFDTCIKRRGEALSLLVDEEPTYGYFPAVYYYRGLTREGMNTAGFADSYREYLKIRGQSTEDPLVAEVRKRVGQ